MALPPISGTGRLTADPDLRYTTSGLAVTTLNLAFNARKQNPQTGDWEDGDTFFVRATAWRQLAENIAESLRRGDEVIITGRLKTTTWETRDGDKRSAPELILDAIGPSLRWATAKPVKASRTTSTSADDPYAPAPADDEPPF